MSAEQTDDETTEVVVLDPRRDGCCEPAVVASWPLEHADAPCLGDVDRLARMQLTALRMGLRVQVVRPSASLAELLGTVGLADLIEPD